MKKKKEQSLFSQIEDIRFKLKTAYNHLSSSDNTLLTEALIYEIKSLEKHHEYLMNEIKKEKAIK